jgi:hypothetical protein
MRLPRCATTSDPNQSSTKCPSSIQRRPCLSRRYWNWLTGSTRPCPKAPAGHPQSCQAAPSPARRHRVERKRPNGCPGRMCALSALTPCETTASPVLKLLIDGVSVVSTATSAPRAMSRVVASNRTSTVPLTLGPIVTPQPTMICPAPLTELSVRDLDLNGTVVGYAAKVVEPVVTDIAVVQHWTRKHREGQ